MDHGNEPIDLLAIQDAAKGSRRKFGLLKTRTVRVTRRPKGIAGFRPRTVVGSVHAPEPVEPAAPKPHRNSGVLLDPKTPLT